MLRIAGPLLGLCARCCKYVRQCAGRRYARDTSNPRLPLNSVSSSAQSPTVDDICRALEQSAAENALPVEFFARVIWQESRFDALAVSTKGAAGIAQFMPRTASWHGLADPFDPVGGAAAFGCLLTRIARPIWQTWIRRRADYNAGPAESAPG